MSIDELILLQDLLKDPEALVTYLVLNPWAPVSLRKTWYGAGSKLHLVRALQRAACGVWCTVGASARPSLPVCRRCLGIAARKVEREIERLNFTL